VSTVDAAPGGKSTGRTAAAVILAIIAILFIIAGLMFIIEPSHSLPSFMAGHDPSSSGHHPLRAAGCLIVGVVFAVGAWFAKSYQPKPEAPAEATPENSAAGKS
jgi:hypothetical protein